VQDRSVPASSVESTDASAGQRICVETDAELPSLVVEPELPVFAILPAELPLPAVAPPTELLVLCAVLLPPPAVLLVALLLEFVPVPVEAVAADEVALPFSCALFDWLEIVPAAPAPTPTFVVVAVICARAGVATNADRTRVAVRKCMAINPCLCRFRKRVPGASWGISSRHRLARSGLGSTATRRTASAGRVHASSRSAKATPSADWIVGTARSSSDDFEEC
jgi:hypothetical protein